MNIVSIPNLAGMLDYFAGNEYVILTATNPARVSLQSFHLGTAAGAGDEVTLKVSTAHNGAGGVSTQFVDSETSASNSTAINVLGGQSLYLYVDSASGSAADLYGQVTLTPVGPTPGISPAYTSLDRVRWLLGFPETYTDQDVYINDLIASVSSSFDSYVGFSFSQSARTEYHNGSQGGEISADYPIASASSVVVKVSGESLDSDQFRVSGQVVTRIDSSGQKVGFLPGSENVEVEYLSGYASVPADVQRSCSEETARAFKNANTGNGVDNRIGITAATPETGGSNSFSPDGWSQTTRFCLNAYRGWM